jgi:hypothetical protein
MPHMPNYKCTPPSGGKGKVVYYIVLILALVIAVKVEYFLAEYLTYILIAIAVVVGIGAGRLAYNIATALRAKTWHMEDASVMSKHDAERVYYGGRYPLDGGPVIKGEVIEGDIRSAYPRAITKGHRKGTTGLPGWEKGTRSRSPRSQEAGDSESRWPKKRP